MRNYILVYKIKQQLIRKEEKMKLKSNIYKGLFTILAIIIATTPCFAVSSNDINSYEINSMKELREEVSALDVTSLSPSEKSALMNKVDPQIVSEFVDDKMDTFIEKVNSIEKSGEGKTVIDLGDNCTATVYTYDVPEKIPGISQINGIDLMASTPGATTLWKPYGYRQFTSRFEIRTGVMDADLIMVNHYTLSSKGIDLRYGESDIVFDPQVNIGSLSTGAISEVVKKAHKIGGKIYIRSTFTYRLAPAYDIPLKTKKFIMHNYVKFSDIDKTEKEVKVVQSWNVEKKNGNE